MTEVEGRVAAAREVDAVRSDMRRVTAVLGLAAAGLLVVGIALLGTFPDDDDGGVKLARYYGDHRGSILAASILLVLGAAASVGFWLGLRGLLKGDGVASLAADIGAGSAVMIFAMAGAAAGAIQTAALLSELHGGLEPSMANTLTLLLTTVTNLSAAPTLLLAAGFAVAMQRTAVVGSWLATALWVVGGAHVLALVSVASSGAFRPGGAMTYLAPVLYLLWLIAAPITLLRQRQ